MTGARVAYAALASLLAGGCGGSGGDEAAGPASTTVTTVVPVTTVAPPSTTASPLRSAAQDTAAARRVLLQAGDLPGYRQGQSSEPSGYVDVYSTCTGNALMPGGRSARSAGQAPFINDETAAVRAVQTTSVSSFAVFAETDVDARRALADLAKPDLAPCVGKALLAELNNLTSPPGTAANQTSAALPPLSVADEVAGLRTTVGGAVSQYFDLTVVRKGRALTFLFVVRLARSPFPEADRQRLAGLLASRIS